MIKQLQEYLEKYTSEWIENRGTYPMVPYDEEESRLYFGQVNEDDYIQWKYEKNDIEVDFSKIEQRLGYLLNNEVKEYYQSFLFLDLQGFFNGSLVVLYLIDEFTNIENLFLYGIENDLTYGIQIGHYGSMELPLYVNFKEGYLFTYDFEKEDECKICDSLTVFFQLLKTSKS